MSITTIMAHYLGHELRARGVQILTSTDCEEVIEAIIRHTATTGATIEASILIIERNPDKE